MIKTWMMRNFKSVAEAELKLATLTILAGPNSAGKSTVLQSMLMTAQTLRTPRDTIPVLLNGSLVRLGPFETVVRNGNSSEQIGIGFSVKLGPYVPSEVKCTYTFTDGGGHTGSIPSLTSARLQMTNIEFSDEDSKDVEILLTRIQDVKPRDSLPRFHAKLQPDDKSFWLDLVRGPEFSYEPNPITGRIQATVVDALRSQTSRQFLAHAKHFLPGDFFAQRRAESTWIADGLVDWLYAAAKIPSDSSAYDGFTQFWEAYDSITYSFHDVANFGGEDYSGLIAETLNSYLTDSLRSAAEFGPDPEPIQSSELEQIADALMTMRPHSVRARVEACIKKFTETQRRHFIGMVKATEENLRDLLSEQLDGYDGPQPIENGEITLPFFEIANRTIRDTFVTKLVYLGPLREEPRSGYPISGVVDPLDIGTRGEGTISILYERGSEPVSLGTLRATANLQYFLSSVPRFNSTLLEATQAWLGYLGVAVEIDVRELGASEFDVVVRTSPHSPWRGLQNVGIGVSQVLPILVSALSAEPGTTLLYEQPELHLHPRVQSRLADFLVAMTLIDRQCIVETHSEYLLNRLRYLATIFDDDYLAQKVQIYFVDNESGATTFRPIQMNGYGVLDDWPKGFFDESDQLAEATLKAAMEKRKNQRGI